MIFYLGDVVRGRFPGPFDGWGRDWTVIPSLSPAAPYWLYRDGEYHFPPPASELVLVYRRPSPPVKRQIRCSEVRANIEKVLERRKQKE